MSIEHDDSDADRAGQPEEESLEALRAGQAARQISYGLDDETDGREVHELPGADLSGEELVVRIIPKMPDEFTCTRCFLVAHQSQRVGGADVCRDCA